MGNYRKRWPKQFGHDFDLDDLRHLRWNNKFKYGIAALVGVLLAGCMCILLTVACVAFLIFNTDESEETVLHRVPSPDQRITALVISDSSGRGSGCSIRVDLQTEDRTLKEVYRSAESCDATLEWEGSNLLLIRDARGEETWLDMRELGL